MNRLHMIVVSALLAGWPVGLGAQTTRPGLESLKAVIERNSAGDIVGVYLNNSKTVADNDRPS